MYGEGWTYSGSPIHVIRGIGHRRWWKGFPRPTATMAEVKGQEDEEDIGRNLPSTSAWPLKRKQKEKDHIWCALKKEASLQLSRLGDKERLECKRGRREWEWKECKGGGLIDCKLYERMTNKRFCKYIYVCMCREVLSSDFGVNVSTTMLSRWMNSERKNEKRAYMRRQCLFSACLFDI